MLINRFYMLSVLGSTVACFLGCSTHRPELRKEPIWPVPSELVRVEVVPGVSVLAPFASYEQGDVQTPWGMTSCKHLEALKHTYRPSAACLWDGHSTSRYLALGWYPNALEKGLQPQEQLDVLERRFSLRGQNSTLQPLKGTWVGWDWTIWADQTLIRNRYVVIGCNVAFLQAVSEEGDPFPEAELFFASLAADARAAECNP
jgi:hypothetical protein